MATKKKTHRKPSFKLPLATVAGFAPAVTSTLTFTSQQGWRGALPHLSRIMTGYNPDDGRFYPQYMIQGIGPIVLGGLVSKFVGGKLGINRMLRGIPFIKL